MLLLFWLSVLVLMLRLEELEAFGLEDLEVAGREHDSHVGCHPMGDSGEAKKDQIDDCPMSMLGRKRTSD